MSWFIIIWENKYVVFFKIFNFFSLRRDRFTKSLQETNKKNVDQKTVNEKTNLYKPSSQNLSSSLSRVDCGRYSLRTSRAPQPNSVCWIINVYNNSINDLTEF